MGTLMMTRESSGLGDLADERVESSSSESDRCPFRFHSGSEYDLVMTTERLVFGLSGMRMHSLSNLTRPSWSSSSGEAIPGNINEADASIGSTMVAVVTVVGFDMPEEEGTRWWWSQDKLECELHSVKKVKWCDSLCMSRLRTQWANHYP